MPKHWIYVLGGQHLRGQADHWSVGKSMSGKSYEVIKAHLEEVARGKLRRVEADDILYVYAHTTYSDDYTTPLGTIGGTHLGAYALAMLLKDEGLTAAIAQVKVFACGSANATAGGGAPYFRQLYDAMRNAAVGFTRVQVCGYEGEVAPAGPGGHKTGGMRHGETVAGISVADWNARQMRAHDKRHCFPA